jgi:hypothetical protein
MVSWLASDGGFNGRATGSKGRREYVDSIEEYMPKGSTLPMHPTEDLDWFA